MIKFSLVILSLWMNYAFADARVVFVRGKVTAMKKSLKKGDVVKDSTTVKTSSGALAVLKLSHGSTIKVNENSSVSIREKNKKASVDVSLKKGSAFFNVLKNKMRGKKRSFRVRTKTVAMGVRGTEFFAALGRASTKKKQDVWMCVREGSVAIKGKLDKKSVLVNAGEGVVSKGNAQTSAPKPLPWTKKLNWNMNPKLGNLENKVSIEEAYSDVLDQDYD